jgi:protein TonB
MTSRQQAMNRVRRNLRLALGALAIVSLHLALIWSLQNGLLVRAAEVLVPAELLSQFIATPQSSPPQKLPATRTASPEQPQPASAAAPAQSAQLQTPNLQAAPLAVAAPAVAPSAPPLSATQAASLAAPTAPTLPAAPQTQAASAPPPTPTPVLQAPTSNADYLQNPKPPYPPMSVRLGETGKTVHKVWIGVDGKAQCAELVSSSGFPRLDKAAHDTVMGWRYVPGKRNGVPEAMAVNVPIQWELSP